MRVAESKRSLFFPSSAPLLSDFMMDLMCRTSARGEREKNSKMPERSSGSGENLNTAIMDTAPPFVPLNPTLLYFPLKNGKRRLEGRREGEGGGWQSSK